MTCNENATGPEWRLVVRMPGAKQRLVRRMLLVPSSDLLWECYWCHAVAWVNRVTNLLESFVSSLHSRDQSQTTALGEILFKIQNWVQVFFLQKYIHAFTVPNKPITFFTPQTCTWFWNDIKFWWILKKKEKKKCYKRITSLIQNHMQHVTWAQWLWSRAENSTI